MSRLSKRFRTCARCGRSYPRGTYASHRLEPDHVAQEPVNTERWSKIHRPEYSVIRVEEMKAMLDDGVSRTDIARHFGISKQRVSQLLLREGLRHEGSRTKSTCFICSTEYDGWSEHQASLDHQATADLLAQRLSETY